MTKDEIDLKGTESRDIIHCHELLQLLWIDALKHYKGMVKPFLTCTYRSQALQLVYKKQGKSKLSFGLHNEYPSKAFDIAFMVNNNLSYDNKLFLEFYNIISNCYKNDSYKDYHNQFNLEWGGNWTNFNDSPHFQISKKS